MLEELNSPHIVAVRGKGLMVGVWSWTSRPHQWSAPAYAAGIAAGQRRGERAALRAAAGHQRGGDREGSSAVDARASRSCNPIFRSGRSFGGIEEMPIIIQPATVDDVLPITAMVNRICRQDIMLPRTEESVRQTLQRLAGGGR
jgi:hypothetical protein